DAENWAEIQRVLRGSKARRTKLNNQIGLGQLTDESGTYPGTTDAAISEAGSRGFYAHWRDLMLKPMPREV
ncbi:MAG: aromatic ring-hydroxylating dioxygenase subunit alpha, partial [Pseudomonadota bacterium]